MVLLNEKAEGQGVAMAAHMMCVAARTAPKGKGRDLLVTGIASGESKGRLVMKMREIASRDELAFFERDAGNIDKVDFVVLVGTRKQPLGLPNCGYCGFADCAALVAAGGMCAFNSGDLGIAIGAAVSRAADLRVDNRVMYSAGKAALELDLLGEDVAIAYAIPLSATGKNPFFDRG